MTVFENRSLLGLVACLLFLFGVSAFGGGGLSDYAFCAQGVTNDLPFVPLVFGSSQSREDTASAIGYACFEIYTPDNIPEPYRDNFRKFQQETTIFDTFGAFNYFLGMGVLEDIPAELKLDLFKNIFPASDAFKKYQEELSKIGDLPSRAQRLEGAYNLVVSTFGKTRINTLFTNPIAQPDQIVNRAAEGKNLVGVCKQASTLMTWTLNQVGLSKNAQKDPWHIPDEDSFTAEREFNLFDLHVWTRVALPVGQGPTRHFDYVDMDPYIYNTQFTPLYQRHKSLTDEQRQKLFAECRQVFTCLHQGHK